MNTERAYDWNDTIGASPTWRFDNYQRALAELPAPGSGCHPALLRVANFGVIADIDPESLIDDIHRAIPAGKRTVPRSEVAEAVDLAYRDHEPGRVYIPKRPKPKVIEFDSDKFWRGIDRDFARCWAEDDAEADLWDKSPVRLDWPPSEDPWRLLEYLYSPSELLFIGDRHKAGVLGVSVRTAAQWIATFKRPAHWTPNFIIPNPLNGKPAAKKSGEGDTYRGDACVASWRFAVVEFDGRSMTQQLKFWLTSKLPVAAIIDSGGKSLHGWVRVDCASAEEWDREVRGKLFGMLKRIGADAACANPARLSRLPGARRNDRCQRLLYLDPRAGL